MYEIDWGQTFGTIFIFALAGGAALLVWFVIVSGKKAEERKKAIDAEFARQRDQRRWNDLHNRFGPEVAPRLFRGEFWQGQTADQLIGALGRPSEIDEHVMVTKTKHIYKYGWISGDRYQKRITLDNGIVVGWEI